MEEYREDEKRLHTWQGKNNSYGWRLVPLTSCMSNISFNLISKFEIPKCIVENTIQKIFLWKEGVGVRKYHLLNWEDVFQTNKDVDSGLLIQKSRGHMYLTMDVKLRK